MACYRSLLYVPGNRPELLAKIQRFPADGYILDLEDGVPADEKVHARELVAEAALEQIKAGRVIHVRINADHTEWYRKDIEAVLSVGVTHLHVPKVNSAQDLLDIDHQVFELATRWRLELEAIELFPTIETSRAVLAADQICAASNRIAGVVLGADDLTAEWGAIRTPEGTEIDYVRQRLIVVAYANGIVPIDATFPFHQDHDGCARDAGRARALGFRGKQAVHPAQCPIFDQAFTPSAAEVERARAIVGAADEARAHGRGTAAAVGTQIDLAVERAARRILDWTDCDEAPTGD